MPPNSPTWNDTVSLPVFPALNTNIATDIAIVGGGITGLNTAYMLSKKGFRVVVLEKNRLAQGTTSAATGFVTQDIDTATATLIERFGEQDARAILSSHAEATNSLEHIIREEHIACDFMRCSNYVYATTEEQLQELRKEKDAASTLEISLQLHTDNALGFENIGYLELQNQAKFHPLKYLSELTRILQSRGVHFFEQTEVTGIQHGKQVILTANNCAITAKYAVIATYAPFNKKLYSEDMLYDTYVLEASLPHGYIQEGTYEDTLEPYHYVRVDAMKENDRIFIGGEDKQSSTLPESAKSFAALEVYAQKLLSDIPYSIQRYWQGSIIESRDGIAWIGPLEEKNVFYATGFSGNGITYSIIAAHSISDAIIGKQHPWARLYRTNRS